MSKRVHHAISSLGNMFKLCPQYDIAFSYDCIDFANVENEERDDTFKRGHC